MYEVSEYVGMCTADWQQLAKPGTVAGGLIRRPGPGLGPA